MAQLLFYDSGSLQHWYGALHTGATYTLNALGVTENLEDLSLSFGNDYLAISIGAGSSDGAVQVRNTRSMSIIATPDISALVAPSSGDEIKKLAFSPDGSKLIVLNGNFPYFKIFDTSDWSLYTDPATKLEASGFISISAVRWSPDSRYVAIQWLNGSVPKFAVYDCDTTTPAQVTSITHVNSHFGVGLEWSPDGARLIVGSSGTLHEPSIYETTGWTTVSLPTGYTSTYRINSVAWADDWVVMAGQQASGGTTRFFYAYDTGGSNDATTWALTSHTPPTNGAYAVTLDNASPPHMAYIGQVGSAYHTMYAITPDQPIVNHKQINNAFETAFKGTVVMRSYEPSSPLPSILAAISAETDHFVQFFNESGVALTNSLSPAVVDSTYSVDISADASMLAVQRFDQTDHFIELYELAGQTFIAELYQNPGYINTIKFSPDGTKLAAAPELSPFIVVYDTTTFAAYSNPSPLPTTNYVYPTYFAWSPDSRYLAVTMFLEDEDMNVLRVYDTNTTTPTVVAAASKNGVTGADYTAGSGAWSPDGTRFVWGGKNPDGEIKIYETSGWTEVALPAVLPSDGHYTVEWAGNFVALLAQENSSDFGIVYDTGASMDPSTWTVASYRPNNPAGGTAALQTSPPLLMLGASGLGVSVGIPSDHPAAFTPITPAEGSGSIYGTAMAALAGEEGELVEAEILEEMAAGDDPSAFLTFNLVEALAAADTPAGQAIKNLLDTLAMGDSATGRSIFMLIERFGLSDALSQQAVLNGTITEAINSVDRLRVILQAVLAEGLELGEDWVGTFPRIAQVVESLMATDAFASRMDAQATLALAMTLGERLLHLTPAQVAEELDVNEAMAARMVANLTLIELADLTMSALAGRIALVGIVEGAALSDGAAGIAQLHATLSEGVEAEAELILFGDVYQGWAVRTDTLAPTEYSNYPFNSMCKLGQRYYGANETGLYHLDGDTDDGDPIRARILTGEMDFASPNLKRIERAYIGMTTRGDMVLKIIVSHSGQRTEYWYRAAALTNGERTEARVKIGEGIVSRYWQFELVNTEGADFEIDRIDIDVRDLKRRI